MVAECLRLPRVKSDAHCTQDTGLKEKREVHTLKYDTRTRKVNNSISKKTPRTASFEKKNRTLNFSQHRQQSKTQL